MKKVDFCAGVLEKLSQVPLTMRQKWEVKDLYVWWLATKRDAPYPAWERAHGDAWKDVLDMCQPFIGHNAM